MKNSTLFNIALLLCSCFFTAHNTYAAKFKDEKQKSNQYYVLFFSDQGSNPHCIVFNRRIKIATVLNQLDKKKPSCGGHNFIYLNQNSEVQNHSKSPKALQEMSEDPYTPEDPKVYDEDKLSELALDNTNDELKLEEISKEAYGLDKESAYKFFKKALYNKIDEESVLLKIDKQSKLNDLASLKKNQSLTLWDNVKKRAPFILIVCAVIAVIGLISKALYKKSNNKKEKEDLETIEEGPTIKTISSP